MVRLRLTHPLTYSINQYIFSRTNMTIIHSLTHSLHHSIPHYVLQAEAAAALAAAAAAAEETDAIMQAKKDAAHVTRTEVVGTYEKVGNLQPNTYPSTFRTYP